MLINMLDIFFTRETLARSSAKGTRVAHNNLAGLSKLLNAVVLSALKEFILKTFKKGNGEPCLTESIFNEVINNKCATARRALNPNKMIYRGLGVKTVVTKIDILLPLLITSPQGLYKR